MDERIYLDHAAAMPVRQEVLLFGMRYLEGFGGNPSTIYREGLEAQAAVARAREQVAMLVGAKDSDAIIFTSGATESNNVAIRGAALRNARKGKRIVASAIEHISVLNPAKDLQKSGFAFTQVGVDRYGTVDLDTLGAAVTPETVVTSVHYANNEIGTIEPIRKSRRSSTTGEGSSTSTLPTRRGGYRSTWSATASIFSPSPEISSGARRGSGRSTSARGSGSSRSSWEAGRSAASGPGPRTSLESPAWGRRPGLQRRRCRERANASARSGTGLSRDQEIEEAFLTGHPTERLPHHASFRFSRIEGESIQLAMNTLGIAVATGSACTSRTLEASHVLLAVGLAHGEAHGSMVATLGRENSTDEVPRIVEAARETVKRLRAITPL
jgi:cysteine desulfurase